MCVLLIDWLLFISTCDTLNTLVKVVLHWRAALGLFALWRLLLAKPRNKSISKVTKFVDLPSSNFSFGSTISSSSSSSSSPPSSFCCSSSSSPFAALAGSTPEAAFPLTLSSEPVSRLSGLGPEGSCMKKISQSSHLVFCLS